LHSSADDETHFRANLAPHASSNHKADSNADGQTVSHADSYANGHANGGTDGNSDCRANRVTDSQSNGHADSNTNEIANAIANTVASYTSDAFFARLPRNISSPQSRQPCHLLQVPGLGELGRKRLLGQRRLRVRRSDL
jgi:hypothetical protein